MVIEDLMRKYKYGYVHSCELLEEPFIKDLLKENERLIMNEKHLLKTIMGLELQNQKYENLIDKIFSRITLLKMQDITMETNEVLDDLLDILKLYEMIKNRNRYLL